MVKFFTLEYTFFKYKTFFTMKLPLFFYIIFLFSPIRGYSSATVGLLSNYQRPFWIKKLEFQEINSWYYLYLKNNLEQASKIKADIIILELDSPGGRVDVALKVVNRLLDLTNDLVVYINKNAISAGALISLTGKKIFINQGGVIGASTPVHIKGNEMVKAPEKMVSVMRAEFRSLAEKYNRSVRVCEAMVDDEIVLTKKKDGFSLPKGKLLTLSHDEALKLKVADFSANGINDVFTKLKIDPQQISFYKITNQLKLLDFFSSSVILGLLLTLGTLGLIFEAKTPGWGLGGTVGLLALSAFFLIQVLLENAGWKEPVIFVIGLILIMMEIFFIPGFGIAGICGILLILCSFFLSFGISNWETALPTVTYSLVSIIVITMIMFKYLPETNIFRRVALQGAIGATVIGDDIEIPVGTLGETFTDLRPVGKIIINDMPHEVQTNGEYIAKGSKVKIIRITSNHIFVKQIS